MKLTEPISKIMTSDIISVLPDALLADMKRLMERRGIHHLPIESQDGQLMGLVSSEDIARVERVYPSIIDVKAQHFMTTDLVKLKPEASIKEVLNTFLENRYRALPVVDANDVLVGIVTPYDFLENLNKNDE